MYSRKEYYKVLRHLQDESILQCMKNILPTIYDYIDFRKFLDDYRSALSSYDPGFTHYYICMRLGMKNSRSYFNNITRGRKNISPETVQKVIELLELKPDEANYFRALVSYDQTRQPDEKKFYLDQIVSLNNTPRKIIDEGAYQYFTNWYNPVIRELLDTFDFCDDYQALAQKIDPPVTLKQAKESISVLEKLDLIEKNEYGFYKSTNKVVTTNDSVQNHLIEQYQLSSLERAREKIVARKADHKTTTMTIAVSRTTLEAIVEYMARLRSSIRSIAHKDECEDKKVYEVILHIHSQSK